MENPKVYILHLFYPKCILRLEMHFHAPWSKFSNAHCVFVIWRFIKQEYILLHETIHWNNISHITSFDTGVISASSSRETQWCNSWVNTVKSRQQNTTVFPQQTLSAPDAWIHAISNRAVTFTYRHCTSTTLPILTLAIRKQMSFGQ